jgi:CHAD domain-containing protein
MARTIDTRYDADGELPPLDGLPADVIALDGSTETWSATYFDTDGLRLNAAGIRLFRREGGTDPGWHLEVPTSSGGLAVRLPLARATRTVPKELRDAVIAFTGDAALQPVCRLATVRRGRHVVGPDGAVLAELVDDRVAAESLADGDEPSEPRDWRVWALEPGTADHGLVEALAAGLREAGGRRTKTSSELERVLGAPGRRSAPRPVRVKRSSATSVLVQARLSELVAELPERDLAVRRDLPGGVHQLRVTLRRIRSLLASFEPVLDPGAVAQLRDEIKWVNDQLGEARDAEVVLALLLTRIDDQPGDIRSPMAVRAVNQAMRRRYREAHRYALAAMESPRYVALLGRLESLAEAPPWRKRARKKVSTVVPDLLRRDVSRLEKRMKRLPEPDDPDHAHRLHQARKAAKRVRYTAETCRPVYGKHARRLQRSMKEFQQRLGDHHDAAMTRAAVRDVATTPEADGRVAFVLGRVDLVEEEEATTISRAVPRWWKQFRPRKLGSWAT